MVQNLNIIVSCSSGRLFAHEAIDCRIDPHGGLIGLFLIPAMCYPLCGLVHIKDPLLLTEKNSPCTGGSRFPLSCHLT